MFKWWHELTNPHCLHCTEQAREDKHCNTCEVLRNQLESSNLERQQLLQRLLYKDIEPTTLDEQYPKETPKINIPWAVKKQMLENESRERAKILRDTIKPDIETLEKEILRVG